MVRIRLTRVGRKHEPAYRIVVTPQREKRDSKVIELIGHYSPITKELKIDGERAKYWLSVGAQPSETVTRLLIKEGVLKAPKAKQKFSKQRGKKSVERAEAKAKKLEEAKKPKEKVEEKAEEPAKEEAEAATPDKE